MSRPNTAPVTRNLEAAALIRAAEAACNGCRTNWRLIEGPRGNFVHPVPGGTVQCWATEQRRALCKIELGVLGLRTVRK